jgi:outer membrane autotransporter protein
MVNAGVVAKGTYGNKQLAVAVTGGTGSIDSTRMVTFPIAATAVGDRNVSYVGVTGRASLVKEMGSMYLKPSLEGAATLVSAGAFTETGAGAANYMIGSSHDVVGRGTASIEIGGEFGSPQDVLFRPYVSVGATLLTGQNFDVEAGFPGLGPGSFTVSTDSDSVFADLRAGMDVLGKSGWATRLEYDGRFSANSQQHSGTVKLSVPF